MIDPPQIVEVAARPAAIIRFTIPRAEIRNAMGSGMGELMATLARQGIVPAGPAFSHHLRLVPDQWDFEIGVPVTTPVRSEGRVTPGELPGATVARAIYRGSYEGLGAAWGELGAWITAHGHAPGADFWECYVRGPESGADPAGWSTELNRPLVRRG